MVAVSTVDGVKYGFRLLGYLLAVVIAGGILVLIGGGFTPGPYGGGNPILAGLFILAGFAVMYAGGLGMLYKVIADGVEVGTYAADNAGAPPSADGGGPPTTQQGGYQGTAGGQATGGQGNRQQ